MKSENLYIETLIIGLEAAVCIFLFCLLIDVNIPFDSINSNSSVILELGVGIGFLYVIGLLVDRFGDFLFGGYMNKVKKEQGLSNISSTRYIFYKYNQKDLLLYIRSRISIIRSTIINLAVAALLLTCITIKNNGLFTSVVSFMYVIAIIVGGFLLIALCTYSFKKMTNWYYRVVQ